MKLSQVISAFTMTVIRLSEAQSGSIGKLKCNSPIGGPCSANSLVNLANVLLRDADRTLHLDNTHQSETIFASDGSGCAFRVSGISCTGDGNDYDSVSIRLLDASTWVSNTCNRCGTNGGTCVTDGFASSFGSLGSCGQILVGVGL